MFVVAVFFITIAWIVISLFLGCTAQDVTRPGDLSKDRKDNDRYTRPTDGGGGITPPTGGGGTTVPPVQPQAGGVVGLVPGTTLQWRLNPFEKNQWDAAITSVSVPLKTWGVLTYEGTDKTWKTNIGVATDSEGRTQKFYQIAAWPQILWLAGGDRGIIYWLTITPWSGPDILENWWRDQGLDRTQRADRDKAAQILLQQIKVSFRLGADP